MAEDTINPSTISLRSKGLYNNSGKLHKGCVKDATTKLSIGSIPSTYESIIYKTDSKKAFGTSEKRFYEKENAPSTQANSEDISTIQSVQTQNKINHNRIGLNSFVSKQKRQWFRCVKTPGPTHYYCKQQKQNEANPRKCLTRQQYKKKQMGDNFEKIEENKQPSSPGPGDYIFDRKQFWNTSYKGWKSSFETKVTRDGYIPESISPGPGCYQFSKANQKKPKVKMQPKQDSKMQANVLVDILKQENRQQLGPGSYNQQLPNFKPLYQRIKMSGNFMTPIFNKKKKSKGGPSPTAYPVKRLYEDLQPKLIQSTFFMSETKRQVMINKDSLGPNPIAPPLLGHKNFHFNIKNQWLC